VDRVYIREIHEYILSQAEGVEVSISVLYVDYQNDCTHEFINSFFPFAIVRPITPFQMDVNISPHQSRAQLNDYQNVFEKELNELKKRTAVVR
jgi:hypothetical protein